MLCRCDEVLSGLPVLVLVPIGNIFILNSIVGTNEPLKASIL